MQLTAGNAVAPDDLLSHPVSNWKMPRPSVPDGAAWLVECEIFQQSLLLAADLFSRQHTCIFSERNMTM